MAASPVSQESRKPSCRLSIVLLLLVGAILPVLSVRAVWNLRPDEISYASQKIPEWDFANLWAGGTLAVSGEVRTLFDTDAYRAWFLAHVGADGANREWSYPPAMLALAAPLAQLPLFSSYLLWTAGGLALLLVLLLWGGVSRTAAIVTVLSPGALNNVVFGQTGALTAALLLGALLLSGRHQARGGVLAGLLTVKPQLGVLLPVCLLAARYWRAIAIAAATAVIVALAVSALFGWDLYPLFFTRTTPLMRAIMEATYPQSYHANAITIFVSLRAAGASVGLAYTAQGMAALVCCLVCWRLWRAPTVDPILRVAATGCLALLVTPYAYTYDMVVLSFATAVLLERAGWRLKAVLILCWLWPSLAVFANTNLFPITPLVVALTAALACRPIWNGPDRNASEAGINPKPARSR
jgi:hypothetical protein